MKKNWITVFKKEFLSYFYSPLGYIFLVLFIFTSGFLTFEPGRGSFFYIRQATLTPFFYYLPWLFLFLVPAICMRTWAEEKKSGTLELLFTLPISTKDAVLGKFLSSWLFLGLALALTFPMVFTVYYLGSPDGWVIFSGYASAFLMGGALTAVCNFFSSCSKNQVVSFILSLSACTALLMAGAPPVLEFLSSLLPNYFLSLFEGLSFLSRFENGERGIWAASDIFFWLSMIIFWLISTIHMLNESRG